MLLMTKKKKSFLLVVVVVADRGEMQDDAADGCYNHHRNDYQHYVERRSYELDKATRMSAGYRCPLCTISMRDISEMRAHLDVHYPKDSPVCPVTFCSKTFTHPNSVRNHMRLKHAVQWDEIKILRWSHM